ncbi:MAG: CRTAC1 family protein [bacterium]|nr:CRTAC1 family protein [bacterium]
MNVRRVALIGIACTACGDERAAVESTPPESSAGPAWFAEVAAQSELAFTHTSGHRPPTYRIPEIMGGGAALFDADGDGKLDVYLVQSGTLGEPRTRPNRLFRNVTAGAELRFEDVTDSSGAGGSGYGMGVATGDYDADGDVDLYVTNWGANLLLRNDGDFTFTDVTATAGVGETSWGTSAAFLDFDADGVPDLYVANYIDWTIGGEITCRNAMGTVDYCNPDNYESPALDTLFRGNGDGTFTDVSESSGIASEPGTGLGIVCSDFDGDGRVDIFVANDGMPDFLWRNTAEGRFENVAAMAGCAVDQFGVAKAGMGVAAIDVDEDGDTDLLVGNIREQTDSFYANQNGLFVDRTLASGLGVTSRPFTRFGLGFFDFDNDGRLDLYQANGRVNRQETPFTDDPFAEPDVVMRGKPDGKFEEILPRGGVAHGLFATGRAAAFGDFDDDGGIDVVVVNRDAPVHLLRNVHPARGSWIGFSVVDEHGAPVPHARVKCTHDGRAVMREVRVESSYLAAHDPRVHIGLGTYGGAVDVEVIWPSGKRESYGERAPGSYHVLRAGR